MHDYLRQAKLGYENSSSEAHDRAAIACALIDIAESLRAIDRRIYDQNVSSGVEEPGSYRR